MLVFCWIEKRYGIENFKSQFKIILGQFIAYFLIILIYLLLSNHLMDINKKLILHGKKTISDM